METLTRNVTFTPLSRGRYRCNQTGQILTQKQILGYVHSMVKIGQAPITKIGVSPPTKKKGTETHASKYRNKQ